MIGIASGDVLLVCGYSAFLLLVAWSLDRLGAHSSARSAAWRTGNFLYHEDQDAWRCHQDQWLWPASFDPDKRVIRYAGQHAVCGRCPAKPECSPTPGPREITRQLDPWPHSEAGRFHRGLALAVAAVALVLPAGMLLGARSVADAICLVAAMLLVVCCGVPLARHLWHTPANFPEQLPRDTLGAVGAPPSATSGPSSPAQETGAALIDRYATRWSGDVTGAGDVRRIDGRPR